MAATPRADVRGLITDDRGSAVRDDGGFVLVTVLVVLGIIGAVVLIISRAASVDMKLADRFVRVAEAEAVADGVVRLALKHLSVNPQAEGRSGALRLDGVPQACRIGEHRADLALVDADGLVNLNLASADLLERLIAGVTGSTADAKRYAQAIIDFRSLGDRSSTGDSKIAPYEEAGLPFGPKNAFFDTVSELDQVAGIPPMVRDRLKPLVTVHSASPIVNLKVASPAVLLALNGSAPGSDTVDFSAAEALRTSLQLPVEFIYVPRTRSTRPTSGRSIVIRVVVHHASGGVFGRQAVANFSTGVSSLPALKEWAELGPSGAIGGGAAVSELPTCLGGLLSLESR